MSGALAVEGIEAAWAALPTNKKLAVAGKLGMWSEFGLERAYNYLKPKIKKASSKMKTRLARTDLPTKKRRKTKGNTYRPNPALATWGVPRGKFTNAKTYEAYSLAPTNQNSNTLYGRSMTLLSKTSTNNIHERQRDVINLLGVSYTMSIFANETALPVQCNVAVVTSKKGDDFNGFGRTSQGDFFRNLKSGGNRSIDFNASVSSMDKHTLPINADEFRILSHERFTLNPRPTILGGGALTVPPLGNQISSNFAQRSKYIRVNKQVRYNDGIPNDIESGPIWFVYWFTALQGPTTVEDDMVAVEFNLRGNFQEVETC